MREAFINYIPELMGGILLIFLTNWVTRRSEKSKAKEQLDNQKVIYENEKDKMITEYDGKLREQEIKFNHDKQLLESQHELEMETVLIKTLNALKDGKQSPGA